MKSNKVNHYAVDAFTRKMLVAAEASLLLKPFGRRLSHTDKKIFIKKNGQKRIHERNYENGKMVRFHAYDYTDEIEEKRYTKIKFRRYTKLNE